MLMFVMWTFSHISHFVCVVLPGITLMEEGVLVIQRVKKEDEGTYECRASNDMGMVVSSASVHVFGEPQLLYFGRVFQMLLKCKSAVASRCWRSTARQRNAWPISNVLQLSVILSCLTNRLDQASALSYPLRERPKLPGMLNVNSCVHFMIRVLARVLSRGSWPLWSQGRALLMSEGQFWGKGPPIKGAWDLKHEPGFLEARSSERCSYWLLHFSCKLCCLTHSYF